MAFGANFLLWMMDLMQNQIQIGWIEDTIRFLSLYSRNEPFLMGQLSWAGIIYDLSFAAAFLAMTIHHLDTRRIRRAGA